MSLVIFLISFSITSCPISKLGWSTVEIEGLYISVKITLSKPITASSCPTLTPFESALFIIPIASISEIAKIAVGSSSKELK